MAELIQVRRKSQVTLPRSARQALNIEEGDFLDVKVKGGEIVLRVKKLVDKEQSWFWTRRWQDGEKEAEGDIRSGRVHKFADAKEAVSFLHKRKSKSSKATGRA